ncbi:phage terminase small subunit [Sphingomonas aracearum]|uniref:Terminase n=1 Tax=Sphingomonas aracearum TaxID=2283317 RepID=A0A369VS46_9SPHN|nr:phage terminase small subunit [Sphingomonas aracearum]RDE04699.1 terminase [Sphingomonas aracearum]
MSPARQHRERLAAEAASSTPAQPIASREEGGQLPSAFAILSSPAAQHQMALSAAARADEGSEAPAPAVNTAAGQIMLRLVHDLRRLKAIQSIEAKVAAKREMLPEYAGWIEIQLHLAEQQDKAAPDEVLAVVMVWLIDTGDFTRALDLAEHMLRFDLPMPSRYQRTCAALVTEEIATAALKAQGAGAAFPIEILKRVQSLTGDTDMHDEIRAKLFKAQGSEFAREAEALPEGDPGFIPAAECALAHLARAKALHERVGVTDKIKRLEKALAKARAAAEPPKE